VYRDCARDSRYDSWTKSTPATRSIGSRDSTGLDWTHKYPAIAKAVAALDARKAYLDGELCGVGPNGITSFSIVQLASDRGNAAALVFFLSDLLTLDGKDLRPRPLIERKEQLGALLANAAPCLHFSDHVVGQGPALYERACAMHVEGIVSKRIDAPYTPGNLGLWRKVKCLNRAEFVLVGWTRAGRKAPISACCCSAITIREADLCRRRQAAQSGARVPGQGTHPACHLAGLYTPEGSPLPPSVAAELERDIARLGLGSARSSKSRRLVDSD
jgi:hypothetical protein